MIRLQRARVALAPALLTLLTACGAQPDTTAISPPAAAPSHRWSVKDGQEYGYATALSKNDQAAGAAAADVLMFRYMGEKDGVYTVAHDANGVLMVSRCANPCQVIKTEDPVNGVTRMTFSPDSLIGGVFVDAFNGQLKPYDLTKDPGYAANVDNTPPPAPSSAASPPGT